MRHLFRCVTVASALVVLTAIAWTQPPGGRFQRRPAAAMLLQQESVQKELKLSKDQL
jgi:hypothetical protein